MKFLYYMITGLLLFGFSGMTFSMQSQEDRINLLRDREIGKIDAVIGYYNSNFSPNAKHQLNLITERFKKDFEDKYGHQAYLLFDKAELMKSLFKRMLDRYFYTARVDQHNDYQYHFHMQTFLTHLEEALSDNNCYAALSRNLIGFKDAIDAIFALNQSMYESTLQRNYLENPTPSLYVESKISHEHSQGKCEKCDRDIGTQWFGDELLCSRCW